MSESDAGPSIPKAAGAPGSAPPTSYSGWSELLADQLESIDAAHLRRRRQAVRHPDATHVELADGRRLINFAANDYLGLSHHPRVLNAAEQALRDGGFGTGASALISGYTRHHAQAEERIADWKGTESAVLLGSGYQANLAAVQTIASLANDAHGVRFLLDKLSHASLIDAVRATGLPFRVFPHNHMEKLERLLAAAPPNELQVVVTESVFSMDGDLAELAALAALKRRRPFVLLLDEAHGSGVYGPAGAGLAAELNLREAVDVSVVTLSKALGCFGGAVCASRMFCELLINRGRAYVYATSVPSCVAAAAVAAIDVMAADPARQARVRALSRKVRTVLGVPGVADSPIIPVILGDAANAMRAAKELTCRGVWALAIRPPTVPRGTSRLRVTLSSAHTDAEVAHLIDAIASLER